MIHAIFTPQLDGRRNYICVHCKMRRRVVRKKEGESTREDLKSEFNRLYTIGLSLYISDEWCE